MLSRVFCLLSLALGCVVFLTGAWPGSFARTTEIEDSAFVPQNLQLDPEVVGESVNASELVTKSLAMLSPERIGWLTTRIRQTMRTPQSTFIAEGMLYRGPHHCARLELTVADGDSTGKLLVVSDGRLIARVHEMPGKPPKTEVDSLPTADAEKRGVLGNFGCDGPIALLQKIQPHVQQATLSTGLLNAEPTIRIKAMLSEKMNEQASIEAPCCCHIYLHAATLWPTRIEWLTLKRNQSAQPTLRVEFLDPKINQELDLATCERLFSYHPTETPH